MYSDAYQVNGKRVVRAIPGFFQQRHCAFDITRRYFLRQANGGSAG
jgi:hypothetical protein